MIIWTNPYIQNHILIVEFFSGFWIVTPPSSLRIVGVLPHYYTASQPRRPLFACCTSSRIVFHTSQQEFEQNTFSKNGRNFASIEWHIILIAISCHQFIQ